MPIWFRCNNCFNKFYTAAPLEIAIIDDECEKCESKLEPIYYEVDEFLKRNLLVNFNFKKQGPARLSKAKIKSYNNKSINLVLLDNKFPDKLFDYRVSCRVSFSRKQHPSGRFYFESELLNYDEDNKSDLIISAPEYLVRKQERSAHRYHLKADVKYRLADDIESLISSDYDKEKRGWTADISESGVLLITENEEVEEINKDKYIDLKIEYDSYKISTIGNIARVENLDNMKNRLALGVEFIQDKADNLSLIDEIRDSKIAY